MALMHFMRHVTSHVALCLVVRNSATRSSGSGGENMEERGEREEREEDEDEEEDEEEEEELPSSAAPRPPSSLSCLSGSWSSDGCPKDTTQQSFPSTAPRSSRVTCSGFVASGTSRNSAASDGWYRGGFVCSTRARS